MEKQTIAVLGPGSWGTALSQVLNDNGYEVRIWGNIPEQINEINTNHTNKHYFKDVVLDENIIAYTDLAEALKDVDLDGKEMKHLEAIIYSMTPEERRKPEILNGSRRKRIADGSGTQIQDVNRMVKQFKEMKKQMKRMKNNKRMNSSLFGNGFSGMFHR